MTWMDREKRRLLVPIYLLLLWSQAIAVVFYGSLRFRFPVEPIIILLAMAGAAQVLGFLIGSGNSGSLDSSRGQQAREPPGMSS